MRFNQNLVVYTIVGAVVLSVFILLASFYLETDFSSNLDSMDEQKSTQYYMALGTDYSVDELLENPDLIRIEKISENRRVHLEPDGEGREYHCASLHVERLSADELKENKQQSDSELVFLSVTNMDLEEVPQFKEIIAATHQIPIPYNDFVYVRFDGAEFVEYEFFLMKKMIEKYGGTKDDYFVKLSDDYEERFTDPKKQGLSNEFNAPRIVYNDTVYAVSGTVFWTSDEHNLSMSLHQKDSLGDRKFITLNETDMKEIPKFKEGIKNIGKKQESVSAFKSLPEPEWNYYFDWYKGEIENQFDTENKAQRVGGFVYGGEYYDLGFGIC